MIFANSANYWMLGVLMYFLGAILFFLLVASALLGVVVLLVATSYVCRASKRQSGLVTLAGGLLGAPLGIGLLFLMHHVLHSSYSGDAVRIALWGASGFGWGGVTAMLIAKLFASPPERGWAGLLLGCEAIAFLIVGLIIHGYANA